MRRFKPDACETCREANRTWGRQLDCRGCAQQAPRLTSENYLVLSLYRQLRPSLVDGWGGINLGNLESGLRLLDIPQAWQARLTLKLLALIEQLLKRQKDQSSNSPDRD